MAARNRSIPFWLALSALLAGSTRGLAQESAAEADVLFEQAMKDMDAGRFDSACWGFKRSDELDPTVNAKFNLAECEERRGRLATAWELFKVVENAVPPSDERHPIARARREEVEPRVPRMKVTLATGAPPGTTVRCDGVALTADRLGRELPLDPGEHELVVTAPGHEPHPVTVRADEGKLREVTVMPGPPTAPPVTAPAAPARGDASSAGAPWLERRTLGFVLGGVGVASLGAGTVTGIVALSKANTAHDHCWDTPQPGCDQRGVDANSSGKVLAQVSTVGIALGVVGTWIGAYLVVSSGPDGATSTAIVTEGSANGASVSVVRHW